MDLAANTAWTCIVVHRFVQRATALVCSMLVLVWAQSECSFKKTGSVKQAWMKAQHEDRLEPDNAAVGRAWVCSMLW